MSIQYRMSEAQPIRRSREQALSDLFIPDQSYGALLRCHLDAGTGMNQKAQWSDSKFQDASRGDKNEGISKTQLRFICNGTATVSKKKYDVILSVLGLPSGNHENDATPNAQAKLANDLRRASGLFDEPTGPPDLLPPPLPPRPPLYRIPHPLSADFDSRRSMIRSTIAEILSAPDNAPERHHLKTLKHEWDDHVLPDPGDGYAADNEAHMLFVNFGLAIKACNEANAAWGGMPRVNAARAGGGYPLRDRCTFIAKLLCAMIWTPLAWQELPSIGKAQTLHHVVEPTLLTAGKEMVRGRDFSLPNDPTHSDDSPNLPGKWQASDLWNFQISPEIAAGIGIDDKILLVNGLAEQFQTKPFERNSAAAVSEDQRLTKFLADLSQIILARAIQEKRVLTLAKSFPAINAPGWNEFFGLVSALLAPGNSVVDGLAFSGEQNRLYVRCNEILLLNQIRFCREQIAAIP